MASQVSSGRSSLSKRYPFPKSSGRLTCGHECEAIVKIAGTPKNRGRAFYRCPYWQDKTGDCQFFKWADELDSESEYGLADLKEDREADAVMPELHSIRQKLNLIEFKLNIVLIAVVGLLLGFVVKIGMQ
ncbi:hypothetical protein LINGRAHAP2_LOCUS28803 [Linum grandiflorum]